MKKTLAVNKIVILSLIVVMVSVLALSMPEASATAPGQPPDCKKGFHIDPSTNQCVADPPQNPVGGEILPIDMTALFVAGVMTNAFWMVPTLGGIAGAAMVLFKVKRKHE